ncbi:hypothetical protein ACJJTC_009781 [Scirpophaga incertulas]
MPKNKTVEAKEQKRLNKKKRYEYIKLNNPEKYASLLTKERERYRRRRQQKKLKSIADMTEREKRSIRKKWKINKSNSRNIKKKMSVPHEVNISETDNITNTQGVQNEQDPLEGSSRNDRHLDLPDHIKKTVALLKKKLQICIKVIQKLKKKNNAYRRILKEHLKNIKIVVVEETKISEKSNSLPKTLPAFKGTLDVHQVLWDLFCGPDLTIRKFSCFKCKAGCACEHGAHLGFFTVPDISEPVTVTVLAAAKNMNDNICFRESLGTYKSSTIMRLNNENEIKDTFREPSTSRNIPTAFDFEQVVPVSVSHVSKMTLYDKENILPTPSTSKTDHIPINLNLKVADWILIKKSERVKKHQIARVIGIYGEDKIDTDVGLTANVVPEPHSDDDDADFILSDHDTRSECSDSEELDSNTEILPTFKWSTTHPSRNV